MTDTLERYLTLPYSVRITPDQYPDGSPCHFARVEELPGCESHGDTVEEARVNLADAMQLYLAAMLEDGLEPPLPNAPVGAAVWTAAPVGTAERTTHLAVPAPRLQSA